MTAKDYLLFALVLIILGILIKVHQVTNSLKPAEGKGVTNKPTQDREIYEQGPTGQKPLRNVRVKNTYNRLVKMIQKDNIPKTEETMLAIYNKQNKKPITAGVMRQWLKWLNGRQLLLSEDFEDGLVWGLPDMFTEGALDEEYVKAIK